MLTSLRRSVPLALWSVIGSGAGLFLLGVSLALGFVIAAQSISQTLLEMRATSAIRVKGFAEAPVVADAAHWTATVRARGTTLPEGFAALENATAQLQAFIVKAGIPQVEQSASQVEFRKHYKSDKAGNSTDELREYSLSQTVTVRSGDVHRVLELSRTSTGLIKKGIEVESSAPSFTVRNVDPIKLKLLAAATANGRERATTLAQGSGGNVGRLISAAQGVFQITGRGSTEITDYGAYDTSSIEKSVKAVVTLDFEVARQ